MLAAHSKFSASKAKQWMGCPGSMVLEVGMPDTSSKYADEGTLAHEVAEAALREPGMSCGGVQGRGDDTMTGYVDHYISNLKQYAEGSEMLVEQRLNYSSFIVVPKDAAWGTSDAVILKGDEIQVHDLKYGMGDIVSPERNPQMMLYALGALAEYDGLAGDFTNVRMVIHQPRVVKAPQEWDCTVTELKEFAVEAKQAAHLVKAAEHGYRGVEQGTKTQAEWEAEYLKPSIDSCRWCKARATCPALRTWATDTVFAHAPATADEFADMTVPGKEHIAPADAAWLGASMAKADLIEVWLKAVRAEVERRLLAGADVPGYKLVQGRQGNRAWSDPVAAEALLKSFRLKEAEMYEFKLISPTVAEKVLTESPKRWAKASALISRADGKPSVAPLSDRRPALEVKPVAEDFADETVADDLG